MSDLISRQAAIEAIRPLQTYKLGEGDSLILISKAEVQTELMMLPSAERKKGKWTQDWIAEELGIYVCSECSQPLGMVNEFMNHTTVNFCPNCGAEMRGEDG